MRSETSLIQTIGRAARNAEGKVILYADKITGSMQRAMDETRRRRKKQIAYNQKHGIVPRTISKKIGDVLEGAAGAGAGGHNSWSSGLAGPAGGAGQGEAGMVAGGFCDNGQAPLIGHNLEQVIADMEKEMKRLAADLEFEQAARLRDEIKQLRQSQLALGGDPGAGHFPSHE